MTKCFHHHIFSPPDSIHTWRRCSNDPNICLANVHHLPHPSTRPQPNLTYALRSHTKPTDSTRPEPAAQTHQNHSDHADIAIFLRGKPSTRSTTYQDTTARVEPPSASHICREENRSICCALGINHDRV